MHLSDFMAERELSDEDVAAGVAAVGVKRDRATVSRWRRRLIRPDWEAIDALKAFTGGVVSADDWTGPLSVSEEPASAEANP